MTRKRRRLAEASSRVCFAIRTSPVAHASTRVTRFRVPSTGRADFLGPPRLDVVVLASRRRTSRRTVAERRARLVATAAERHAVAAQRVRFGRHRVASHRGVTEAHGLGPGLAGSVPEGVAAPRTRAGRREVRRGVGRTRHRRRVPSCAPPFPIRVPGPSRRLARLAPDHGPGVRVPVVRVGDAAQTGDRNARSRNRSTRWRPRPRRRGRIESSCRRPTPPPRQDARPRGAGRASTDAASPRPSPPSRRPPTGPPASVATRTSRRRETTPASLLNGRSEKPEKPGKTLGLIDCWPLTHEAPRVVSMVVSRRRRRGDVRALRPARLVSFGISSVRRDGRRRRARCARARRAPRARASPPARVAHRLARSAPSRVASRRSRPTRRRLSWRRSRRPPAIERRTRRPRRVRRPGRDAVQGDVRHAREAHQVGVFVGGGAQTQRLLDPPRRGRAQGRL